MALGLHRRPIGLSM